jgi:aspartyl aminopeptidase
MDAADYNRNLFSFLSRSPTPFHAVAMIGKDLQAHGFIPLRENEAWQLVQGQAYFVARDSGAVIAFTMGSKEELVQGFRFLAAHTDSPCLQVKPCAAIKTGSYLQLGVEVYGGSLLGPWFDRDLSLAGRVCGRTSDGNLAARLIDFRRPLLTIPSIAIHFDREANKNGGINQQKHLPPILSQAIDRQLPDFNTLLLEQLKVEHPEDAAIVEILSFDLFCYDCQKPVTTGANSEFISSARLDNLVSCHAGMTALSSAERTGNALLFCANHEENGSTSATGAHGSFLDSVLERIIADPATRRIALSNSFLVSMDNAHAAHPNFMEKIDAAHEIHLNTGPVIKHNANQRYATTSVSAAIFKDICREAGVTPQEFVMRSDLPCGSTIGPITAARLGVRTVDVGAASLAMHSIREHTGVLDPFLLFRAIEQFLKSATHRKIAI